MSMPDRYQACAAALETARRDAEPLASLDAWIDADDVAAGYAVQAALTDMAAKAGRVAIGWKIGLTSPAALAAFAAAEPMVGIIYADSRIAPAEALDLATLCSPRIEGEMLLEIGEPVAPDADDNSLLASIASVRPAFEIADSRVAGFARRIGHAIADNACCGRILFDDRSAAASAKELDAARITVTENGAAISTGTGADCLNGILNVYRWFLQDSARVGRRLAPGQLILTGAIGAANPMRRGVRYGLEMNDMPRLTLDILE